MRIERVAICVVIIAIACAAVFSLAGPVWGWRAIGVVSLAGAVGALRDRRLGLNAQAPQTKFVSRVAMVAEAAGAAVSVAIIVFAERIAGIGP